MINKWQIDMERSLRFNTLFFYRTPTLLFLLLLFPVLVQATESVYEQQIQQARNGNYTPFLDYLQRYQQQHALTPEHVADWLQVAAWAGHDDEVIQVWQRYGIYMPLPARGVAAVAQARRNQKAWQPALALWKERAALRRITTIIVSAISKPWPMPAWIRLPCRKPDGWWRRPSQAHLQTLSYVWLRQGKSWDRLLATRAR
jgi:biofilm PGA synthesis protein PgaA